MYFSCCQLLHAVATSRAFLLARRNSDWTPEPSLHLSHSNLDAARCLTHRCHPCTLVSIGTQLRQKLMAPLEHAPCLLHIPLGTAASHPAHILPRAAAPPIPRAKHTDRQLHQKTPKQRHKLRPGTRETDRTGTCAHATTPGLLAQRAQVSALRSCAQDRLIEANQRHACRLWHVALAARPSAAGYTGPCTLGTPFIVHCSPTTQRWHMLRPQSTAQTKTEQSRVQGPHSPAEQKPRAGSPASRNDTTDNRRGAS